jgi:hypothetical protein
MAVDISEYRNDLGRLGVGNLVQAALPDLDKYLKLRAM